MPGAHIPWRIDRGRPSQELLDACLRNLLLTVPWLVCREDGLQGTAPEPVSCNMVTGVVVPSLVHLYRSVEFSILTLHCVHDLRRVSSQILGIPISQNEVLMVSGFRTPYDGEAS